MAEPSKIFSNNLTLEARLLLYCARLDVDSETAGQIRELIQENIDWDTLLHIAIDHKVAPLLYRNLEAVSPSAMPEIIRAELKQQVQMIMQENLYLTKELIHVQKLFKQHDIPVFPIKGPVLASGLYGNLSLRPFTDLDIMVHKGDILRVLDVLLSCGYEILKPAQIARAGNLFRSFLINWLVNVSPWSYHFILRHPDWGGIIELHWQIAAKFIFWGSSEPLWDELTEANIGGITTLSFSPENLLWFICVHGSKQQWKRLGWVCDVAQVIHKYPELNWDLVMERSVKLGVERRLHLGLLLAHSMLNAPLPTAVDRRIRSIPDVKTLANVVMDNFSAGREPKVGFPLTKILNFQWKAMDNIVSRVRFGFYFLVWELLQALLRLKD